MYGFLIVTGPGERIGEPFFEESEPVVIPPIGYENRIWGMWPIAANLIAGKYTATFEAEMLRGYYPPEMSDPHLPKRTIGRESLSVHGHYVY